MKVVSIITMPLIFVAPGLLSGSAIAFILLLMIINYIKNQITKGGLPMEKNKEMSPTANLKSALLSAIETLWAIGCSAAASPWVQKETDINFRVLN
jgi:hypothetical protein